TERGNAAGTLRRLVQSGVLHRLLFRRMAVGKLACNDDRACRHVRAFDVLAADAQEVVVRNAVGVPDAPMTTASGFAAISFNTCPTTLVSFGAKRSFATSGMPRAAAAFSISTKNASPSASENPT